MSYILDALKKSEQERGHGNIPNVQTVHTSSLNYHNKKTLWPYVLIVAVLLNLAAIVYFYLDKEKVTTDNMTAIVTSTDQHENIQATNDTMANETMGIEKQSELTATIAPETTRITSQKASTYNQETITSQSTPPIMTNNSAETSRQSPVIKSNTVAENNADIIDFHDLPESIKRQLPSIVVSAHVYSSNPLQRSIVINNNFLEEGEYILDGLILQEITPDGAILEYQGTRFSYPVVSGWQ